MLQFAPERLIQGVIRLGVGQEQSCWQILEPEYELERAIERYITRHTLDVPWLRLHQPRHRGGAWLVCQLMAFAGSEEQVLALINAAITEWNAEPDSPRPRSGMLQRPLRRPYRAPLTEQPRPGGFGRLDQSTRDAPGWEGFEETWSNEW